MLHRSADFTASARTPQSSGYASSLLCFVRSFSPSFICPFHKPTTRAFTVSASMDGDPNPALRGPLAYAAQARRKPRLQRAATDPAPRHGLSLLAGVSDEDRRSRALAKFIKLETLLNRVQTSPRPFSSAAWTHKIEPELREAQRAEQQARAAPATRDPRPEQASEEIEAFVEATDRLKSSVDQVS